MKNRIFILLTFVFTLLFGAGYVALFGMQLEAPVQAAWWVKNVYDIKDDRARSIDGPKMIILSGSNGLFGIDSKVLEETSGFPVVNLAAHGSLDLNFYYEKLKEHIGENDVVVMPLEYDYYFASDTLSEWFCNNISAWGADDYLSKLSRWEYLKFIYGTPKERVFEGLQLINDTTEGSKMIFEEAAIHNLDSVINHFGQSWRGYSYESLNLYGDFLADEPLDTQIVSYNAGYEGEYVKKDGIISEYFLEIYKKIEDLVAENNGTLILTHPVSMRHRLFDLGVKENWRYLNSLIVQLKQQGIDLHFNPALFNLNPKFFFNTHYHLNYNGAQIRTNLLAQRIEALLSGDYTEMTNEEAFRHVRAIEEEYLANPISIPRSPFQIAQEKRLEGWENEEDNARIYINEEGRFAASSEAQWGSVFKVLQLEIGKTYQVKCNFVRTTQGEGNNGTWSMTIRDLASGYIPGKLDLSEVLVVNSDTPPQELTLTFTAISESARVLWFSNVPGNTTVEFENLSVTELLDN